MKQLFILPLASLDRVTPWSRSCTVREFVGPRAIELLYVGYDLSALGADFGFQFPFLRDEERRRAINAELVACFFHLYGIERDDVEYIMDTFPIVKRKDEASFGEYRTKRLILEWFDAMAKAEEAGLEYDTVLDPPPAHPSLAHDPSTRPAWADWYVKGGAS